MTLSCAGNTRHAVARLQQRKNNAAAAPARRGQAQEEQGMCVTLAPTQACMSFPTLSLPPSAQDGLTPLFVALRDGNTEVARTLAGA